MVQAKRNVSSEIIWKHQMAFLGCEVQVEAHFNLFGDSASLNAR
jgi:hypothetical protein